jgi:hypothetical protein
MRRGEFVFAILYIPLASVGRKQYLHTTLVRGLLLDKHDNYGLRMWGWHTRRSGHRDCRQLPRSYMKDNEQVLLSQPKFSRHMLEL